MGDVGTSSPVMGRVHDAWASMRDVVAAGFPRPPERAVDRDAALAAMDEAFVSDAYHSLSIEGYRVSEDLLRRVEAGEREPEATGRTGARDVMAAVGYLHAFRETRDLASRILEGEDGAALVERRHLSILRSLFQPAFASGILRPENLAGYRTHRVFIWGSAHVPTSPASVPDAMQAYFACLAAERDAGVRAVLGHLVFTSIHPFADGNGRTGRLIMNAMLLEGGYPWTVIPVDASDDYLAALERASVAGDVAPLTGLVAACVAADLPPPRRGATRPSP